MKKRLLAMMMALVMCLSLLPTAAFAAASYTTNGSYSGNVWSEGGNGSVTTNEGIKLTKTAQETKTPGVFDITLKVETSTTTTMTTNAAATVLVIDTSSSMKSCAECGGRDYHKNPCNAGSGSVQIAQSRMNAAKAAAGEFLAGYAGKDAAASRYLAIVTFDSDGRINSTWVNVAGGEHQNAYDTALSTINGLKYNMGTNLEAGLQRALELLKDNTVKNFSSKNVVLLSDGAPTACVGDNKMGTDKADCTNAIDEADAIKGSPINAPLYTVCFGAENDKCYGELTVAAYLSGSIASPDKAYTAGNTDELNTAFKAITDDVTSGIDGAGATVTDPMSRYVDLKVETVPNDKATVEGDSISWELKDPAVTPNGNTKTYTYELTYQVTLKEDYRDGETFYPANEPTYLTLPNSQTPLYFPVPGLKADPTRVAEFTGETASKVYNGAEQELTDVTSNLDSSYTSNVTYSAKGTNVGEYDGEFTHQGPVIIMKGDRDVTNTFASITTTPGKLTITPKPVTITADSGEKVYDGTALTKDTYTSEGLATGDSIASVTVTGSQTVVGKSDNVPSAAKIVNAAGEDVTASYKITYANGTLEVTKKAVTITADSDSKFYDGTALTKNSYTNTALAEGDSIEAVTVTGSQIEVGASDNVPSAAVIKSAAGEDVTASYEITYANGTLEVKEKMALTITAGSDTKVYDGTALTKNSYTNTALAEGDRIESVTVTGSQTVVGKSDNVPSAAKIVNAAGQDVTGHYAITYVDGTLEVTKKAVTITADGATKVYDGTALSKDSYTNTALAEGDSIESVTVTGSQTVVGTSDNVPSAAVIKNAAGADVTGNYDITYANGTLEVTKKALTITADGATKVYDGTALTKDSFTNTDLAEGDSIESVTVTGSQTTVGKSDNVPSDAKIVNTDGKDVTASYAITYMKGELEVTKKPITITADSASKTYDGKPLTKNSYTSTDLAEGDKIDSVTVTGSQTEVGKSDNVPDAAVIKNAAGEDVSSSYEITYANGTLEVTKKPSRPSTPNIPDNPPALNTEDHYAYIIGYPDGEVKPAGNITRAEVATIFFRLLTDEARDLFWSTENAYSDVAAGQWFNNAISTLSNAGIINGYEDGSFRPNAPITRAEFSKIAVSFFSYVDEEYQGLFPDVPATKWYALFVEAAQELGLITGYEDGTFRPEQNISRAEACTIVNRTIQRAPHEDQLHEDMVVWPDNPAPGEVGHMWYYEQVQEATNSHDYTFANDYEDWTEILENRDWAALEQAWADSNDAPGGEVIR